MDTKVGQPKDEDSSQKYGARVSLFADGKAVVKQTIKSAANKKGEYVIDNHRERIVDLNNDADVAAAIRAALTGQLPL